jgi:hypothetical protein
LEGIYGGNCEGGEACYWIAHVAGLQPQPTARGVGGGGHPYVENPIEKRVRIRFDSATVLPTNRPMQRTCDVIGEPKKMQIKHTHTHTSRVG